MKSNQKVKSISFCYVNILLFLITLVLASPLTIAQTRSTNQAEKDKVTNMSGKALPTCAYEHIATAYQDLADWQRTFLDTLYYVPKDYVPTDLVSVQEAGFGQNGLVRSVMIDDLKALHDAAAAAGHPLAVQSAHRSYDYQQRTFDYWVNVSGETAALQSSARAGHSEHQMGTALDFRSADGIPAWDLQDWADTPTGAWTIDNAWRYGFVLSYPKSKQDITCYIYEPWHYRYMGRTIAKQIHESGLTLREWLWQLQP